MSAFVRIGNRMIRADRIAVVELDRKTGDVVLHIEPVAGGNPWVERFRKGPDADAALAVVESIMPDPRNASEPVTAIGGIMPGTMAENTVTK